MSAYMVLLFNYLRVQTRILHKEFIMKSISKLGILAIVLAFVGAVVLTGCDSGPEPETEYTLINNSSYTVSGSLGHLGSRSFSVSSGNTTHVMGPPLVVIITYSPGDRVNCTSYEGHRVIFTNK